MVKLFRNKLLFKNRVSKILKWTGRVLFLKKENNCKQLDIILNYLVLWMRKLAPNLTAVAFAFPAIRVSLIKI